MGEQQMSMMTQSQEHGGQIGKRKALLYHRLLRNACTSYTTASRVLLCKSSSLS